MKQFIALIITIAIIFTWFFPAICLHFHPEWNVPGYAGFYILIVLLTIGWGLFLAFNWEDI